MIIHENGGVLLKLMDYLLGRKDSWKILNCVSNHKDLEFDFGGGD